MKEVIIELENLVKAGKIDDTLKRFDAVIKEFKLTGDLKNSYMLLSSKFHTLKIEYSQGILDGNEKDKRWSLIALSLLQLISGLETEFINSGSNLLKGKDSDIEGKIVERTTNPEKEQVILPFNIYDQILFNGRLVNYQKGIGPLSFYEKERILFNRMDELFKVKKKIESMSEMYANIDNYFMIWFIFRSEKWVKKLIHEHVWVKVYFESPIHTIFIYFTSTFQVQVFNWQQFNQIFNSMRIKTIRKATDEMFIKTILKPHKLPRIVQFLRSIAMYNYDKLSKLEKVINQEMIDVCKLIIDLKQQKDNAETDKEENK